MIAAGSNKSIFLGFNFFLNFSFHFLPTYFYEDIDIGLTSS